jgi:NAD+ diphosphatase
MRHSEAVTFGGSGLDRAAYLRGDTAVLAAHLATGVEMVLPIWNGKPLVEEAGGLQQLCWVPAGHPILASASANMILLGISDGLPRFAADISDWVPVDLDEAQIGSFLDPTAQIHPAAKLGHVFREIRAIMTALSPRDAELAVTAKALLGWHQTHGFCSRCGSTSEVSQAGWQRTCPQCGAHHFPRTDPVVIMLITYGNDVLLGRSPGWPEGMYSLLAGFVEPGETIEAAVRREVLEETDIRVSDVSYLASQPWPYPSSLMMGCRGQATSREIKVDPVEIEDAIWVSREALAEAFAGRNPKILPARKGAIAHFLLENWLADRLN